MGKLSDALEKRQQENKIVTTRFDTDRKSEIPEPD